jgi:hypothetical protein
MNLKLRKAARESQTNPKPVMGKSPYGKYRLSGFLFLSESITNKALRKAYRAKARVELCRLGFWVFAASLWGITFLGVALLTFVGCIISNCLFNAHDVAEQSPLVTGFHWANLIEAFFLIAIAVLYIWGGPAGIPFLPSARNGNEKT